MKKQKNILTQAQYQILCKHDKDALTTEKWIKETGLTVCVFNRLPVQVLKAQQVAHTLLTQNKKLLTNEQIKTIRAFQRKVGNTKNHKNLNPSTAFPILNINNKINRQLFKQHNQISKPSATAINI
jgi:hypothetical protein